MQELYENLTGEEGNLIPEVIRTVGNLYFLRNDIDDFRDALGKMPKFENLENLIQIIPPSNFIDSVWNFIKKIWDRYCSLRTDPDFGEKIISKKFEIAKKIGKLRKVRESYQDVEEDSEFEIFFAPYEIDLLLDIKNKIAKSAEIVESKTKLATIGVKKLEEILNKTNELRLINLAMASYIYSVSSVIAEIEKDSLAKAANVSYFKYQMALPELNNLFKIFGKTLIQLINRDVKSRAFIDPSPMLLVNQKIIPQEKYRIGTIEASLLYYPDYFIVGLNGFKIIENFFKSKLPALIKNQKFEEFLLNNTDMNFVDRLKQEISASSPGSTMSLAVRNPSIINELLINEEINAKLKDLLKKEKIDVSAINVYLNFLRDWRKAEALFPALNRIRNVEYLLRSEEKRAKLKEEHENGNVYVFDEKPIVYRNKKTIDINFDMRNSTEHFQKLGKENFNKLFDELFDHPALIELCKKYKVNQRKTRYAGDEQIYSFRGISYPAVNSLLFIKEFLQEFKNDREAKKELIKSKYEEEFDLEFGVALYMHFFNQEEPGKYERGINIVRELSKSLKKLDDDFVHPSVYISEKGIYNCGLIIADNCDPDSRETFVKSLEDELISLNRIDILELKNEPFYKLFAVVKERKGDIRMKSSKDLEKEGENPFTNPLCMEYHLLNSFSKYKNAEGEYEFKYRDMENEERIFYIKEAPFKEIIKKYSSGYTLYYIPLISSDKYPDLIKIKEKYPLRSYTLDLYMMPLDEKDFFNFILYNHNLILEHIQAALKRKSEGKT